MYRKILFGLLLFLGPMNSQDTQEPIKNKVQWSGLSYINQNVEVSEKYPNMSILEPYLRKIIINNLKNIDGLTYDLNLIPSDSFKDGSFSIILAFDTEKVSAIDFDIMGRSNCLSTYYLSMQLIVYSPADQSILQIIPFNARRIYTDPKTKNCNVRNKKLDLFRFTQFLLNLDISTADFERYLKLSNEEMINVLTERSLSKNLINKSGTLFGNFFLGVKNLDFNRIKNTLFFVGVSDVNIEELAFDQLSGKKEFIENNYFSDFYGFDKMSYQVWVGQQFVKWFSKEFNFPLVPYVKGRALGKDIAIKFADSDEILNLELPVLDWGFKINIRGFKRVKLDESRLREAYAWASFGDITFENVDIKNYGTISVKNVYTEEVNKGDGIDDWGKFDTSLNAFLNKYIKNIKINDKTWVKDNTKLKLKDFQKQTSIIIEKLKLK